MKQIPKVRPPTTNAAVYGELGSSPLSITLREKTLVKDIESLGPLIYKTHPNMKDGTQNITGWPLAVNKC